MLRFVSFLPFTAWAQQPWLNVTNVGLFLTFDDLTPEEIAKNAEDYDYVWGAPEDHIPLYRASSNPNIVLSYYMPYSRDCSHGDYDSAFAEYWNATHPDWIMYKCDRKTPAWYGQETGHCVPLDVSNPEVAQWQINAFAGPMAAAGYDAIAADNFNLNNDYQACGVYDKNGSWIQKWSGDWKDDAWTASALSWMRVFSAELHQLPTVRQRPMALVPNFGLHGSGRHWDDAAVLAVGNYSDAILDEAGFTGWGAARIRDAELEDVFKFMANMQSQNKAYFSINELDTQNLTDAESREWVVASYLAGRQARSGLFMSGISQYGSLQGAFPEYNISIGEPLEPFALRSNDLWVREYSHGVALLNGQEHIPSVAWKLDPAFDWYDVYGEQLATSTVVVAPLTARIAIKVPKQFAI
eukprot:TRINITY_DN31055_c0_g1_i1.p1 TRINITY_DN31055_c0_g1~~TRINITY_DN31055_c0_g1_i1.p1  ORF type:complete len:428 (-),score=51.38 TRINITY_DN31055_c0_g1_i1:71-1303(-)